MIIFPGQRIFSVTMTHDQFAFFTECESKMKCDTCGEHKSSTEINPEKGNELVLCSKCSSAKFSSY